MYVIKVTTNYPNGFVGEAYYTGKFMGILEFCCGIKGAKRFEGRDAATEVLREISCNLGRADRTVEIVEVA